MPVARLRKGDIRASVLTAKKFDTDYHFIAVEIAGDDLYFQAISRTGETIDSGVVHRPGAPAVRTAPHPKEVVGRSADTVTRAATPVGAERASARPTAGSAGRRSGLASS